MTGDSAIRTGEERLREPLPLFVYGTLLDQPLMERLLEHGVTAETASLLEYEVGRLPAFDYPVVVPSLGCAVRGRVYRDLSGDDLRRLDLYEGVGEGLYRRVRARAAVSPPDDGEVLEVWVYVPTSATLQRYGGAGDVVRPEEAS